MLHRMSRQAASARSGSARPLESTRSSARIDSTLAPSSASMIDRSSSISMLTSMQSRGRNLRKSFWLHALMRAQRALGSSQIRTPATEKVVRRSGRCWGRARGGPQGKFGKGAKRARAAGMTPEEPMDVDGDEE